jgi:hypothetical protein
VSAIEKRRRRELTAITMAYLTEKTRQFCVVCESRERTESRFFSERMETTW